MKNILSKPN